jgi:dTDP-glucose 4,6-dehydratase
MDIIGANDNGRWKHLGAKVCVTGGLGFIGSHLVRDIAEARPNIEIVVLDAETYAASIEVKIEFENRANVTVLNGDIRSQLSVRNAFDGCFQIFHLAAESHVSRSFDCPELFHTVNAGGTQVVMEEACKSGCASIFHMSTDEVYGATESDVSENAEQKPTTPYSLSKAEAEKIAVNCRKNGVPIQIARPANAVGVGQHNEKLVPKFIELVLQRAPLTIEGSGKQERAFLPVEDLVAAIEIMTQKGDLNGAYNVPGSERFTVLEIAKLIDSLAGTNSDLNFVTDRITNDAFYRMCGEKIGSLGYQQTSNLKEVIASILLKNRTIIDAPKLVPSIAQMHLDQIKSKA